MKIYIFICILLALIGFTKMFAQTFEVDGINYFVTGSNDVRVTAKTGCYTGDLVIPSTVEDSGITYNVTAIGVNAFYQCSGLTGITLPNSMAEIQSQAFLECTNLSSINFPSSITSIGYMAFRSCTSLATIDLSATVITSIGEYAFLRCENTTSIILPNTLERIDNNVFHYCESLTQIVIPNSVTSIGTRSFAYSGLTSIDIPSSVTLIDNYAFEVCRDMKTVNVPSSVTSIGDYAFYGNYTLEAFNIDIEVPLTITTSVFQGRNLFLVTLSVPVGSDSAYSVASIWQDFGNINGTLSNNKFIASKELKAYPKPAINELKIVGIDMPESFKIYNALGNVVMRSKIVNNKSINLEGMIPGLYFLEFSGKEVIRFIKK